MVIILGILGWLLLGLWVLIFLEENAPDQMDEMMGNNKAAALTGWIGWPVTLTAALYLQRQAIRRGSGT